MHPANIAPLETVKVHKSLLHPIHATKVAVFGVHLVRPLGMAMLPVMVTSLVAMLQGYPVLAFLYAGFPIALILSMMWTWIQVRNRICEIHLANQKIALRSLFSASDPVDPLHWKGLLHVEKVGDRINVTAGLENYSIVAEEWPNWSVLVQQLHHYSPSGTHDYLES